MVTRVEKHEITTNRAVHVTCKNVTGYELQLCYSVAYDRIAFTMCYKMFFNFRFNNLT